MDFVELTQVIVTVIVGAAGISFIGMFFGLFYKGVDRKLAAHMQGRIGPPIRQPFRDVIKLFTKENIVPENAISWVFNIIPVIGLVGAISIRLFIPVASPLFAST